MPTLNKGLFTSLSAEWYTPPWVIDLARNVMGSIDLDPCSPYWLPISTVGAEFRFNINDDGLKRDWFKNVLVNPPYGREIADWVRWYNIQRANMEQCINVIPARTDTEWFHSLECDAICYIKKRLKFVAGNWLAYRYWLLGEVALRDWWSGDGYSAPFPSALTYHGKNVDFFMQLCEPHGMVFRK